MTTRSNGSSPSPGSSIRAEPIGAATQSLGKTLTISVVVSFLTRPQAAERLRGVDAVLADSEFDLVIYNVETVEKRDHYLQTLPLRRSAPTACSSCRCRPRRGRVDVSNDPVPVVFIDVARTTVEAMPRVVGDDVAGGALAARHLLDLGHRRIGFVGDAFDNPFGFTSSRDRVAG